VVDSGKNFVFDLHRPSSTRSSSTTGSRPLDRSRRRDVHFVASRNGGVFFHNFNSKEGPIQIIQHETALIDPDGNVTFDRTYEKIGSC
jgi:hypothetical protein